MKTLIVAPHPDDELLGCGGTVLRRISEGSQVGLVFMTAISTEHGWDSSFVDRRQAEIAEVVVRLGLNNKDVFQLGFPAAQLDQVPMGAMVQTLSQVFQIFKPNEILSPHIGDVHSDHRITAEVVASSAKWFRCPSVERVMAYETLSETGFGLSSEKMFKPNVYVDISPWLSEKLDLLRIYSSEMEQFPFPRSGDAVKALAQVHGSNSGCSSAEAFELLLERQRFAHESVE
jgi:LmbE family N-acetylglucosaminyl deacetylase